MGGFDSGCWYNVFDTILITHTTRGITLLPPRGTTAGAGGSNVNRNTFRSVRIGESVNTGVHVQSGATNVFEHLSCEGITSETSPSATPTAVVIDPTDTVSGFDNNDNVFVGPMFEGNTRDFDSSSALYSILGGSVDATKINGSKPAVLLGFAASVQPLVLRSIEYGEGVTGYASGYIKVTKPNYESGGELATATSLSGTVNIAASSSVNHRYQRLSGMVDWAGSFQFQATTAGNQIEFSVPAAPPTWMMNLYAGNPFFPVYVNDGTGMKATEARFTTGGKMYVKPPSGSTWQTASASNAVFWSVKYPGA